MEAILKRLARRSDIVIIDAPPVNVVTDAVLLAKLADGAILVVDSGHTRRKAARAACDALERVGVRILGVTVNRSTEEANRTYGYYEDAKAEGAIDKPQTAGVPARAEESRSIATTRTALITGITGQDGSYLAEFLLAKGYEVHGIVRRSRSFTRGASTTSTRNPAVRRAAVPALRRLSDSTCLVKLLYRIQPDEVYNLAAQSHVRVSFDIPEYTGDVTGLGTIRILEAIRETGLKAKPLLPGGRSEMFGKVAEIPQRETTPFHPRSPYAVAKVYAHWATVNYREAYGMFACNGILFNHESPAPGRTFVTRKITRAVARITPARPRQAAPGQPGRAARLGLRQGVRGGDVADAAAAPKPDDYVVATGETHSVREFCEEAFGHAGLARRNDETTEDRGKEN